MKKLVPFKKDILFENSISEINSISLEHIVDIKEDNLIKGKFIVSGDYKVNPTSTHLDDFEFELPFNINVDKKYIIEDSEVDISDFYYEIMNNKTLCVEIELCVDNVLEREEEVLDRNDEVMEYNDGDDSVEQVREGMNNNAADIKINDSLMEDFDEGAVKSIFGNLDDNENYVTYKIHFVTENDTTESIMQEYSVTREMLMDYNDLSDFKIGAKIIVPGNEN